MKCRKMLVGSKSAIAQAFSDTSFRSGYPPTFESRLDFFSVFHRAGKGHAVSEANITADRDTAADAGDLDAGRFDETGEIESRGLAGAVENRKEV